MSKLNYYIVHETEDSKSDVICEGLYREVTKFFDLDLEKLKKVVHSKTHLLFGTYYVETMLYEDWKVKQGIIVKDIPKESGPKVSKWRKHIDTIEQHLDIYGNTIIYKQTNKVVNALEKDGYFVNAVHEPKRVIRYLTKGQKEVFPECWILNLIKKETIECSD